MKGKVVTKNLTFKLILTQKQYKNKIWRKKKKLGLSKKWRTGKVIQIEEDEWEIYMKKREGNLTSGKWLENQNVKQMSWYKEEYF